MLNGDKINLQMRHDLPSRTCSRSNQLVAHRLDAYRCLEAAMETLGVTPTKLSKLLGTGNPSVVFKWTTGMQTPSQPYCLRIMFLLSLAAQHVPLGLVRTIDWNTYEIEWHKGCAPGDETEGEAALPLRVPADE